MQEKNVYFFIASDCQKLASSFNQPLKLYLRLQGSQADCAVAKMKRHDILAA